ncbi:MAG: hypothetical protein JWN03_5726 [Nocardia sp.]|uniref:hypothetical protein n=1 Tax=Nocardia sp. TaxID=1821 RepID=UPI00261ABB02|nr:hypothetical protein [Nocardia sp.]MCU1645451.1 hypothetical protein [Nocardia sp.]
MLHTLTEDLASFLSEVTQDALGCPVPHSARDVGELCLHLIDQNIDVATAVAGEKVAYRQWAGSLDRASLDTSVDYYYGGAGLEVGYRRTAGLMENSFASVTDMSRLRRVKGFQEEVDIATLYEEQIRNTVIHTWDVAQALGFSYQPAPGVTQRILRTTVLRTPPSTVPDGTGAWPGGVDDASAFAAVLTLSSRGR